MDNLLKQPHAFHIAMRIFPKILKLSILLNTPSQNPRHKCHRIAEYINIQSLIAIVFPKATQEKPSNPSVK